MALDPILQAKIEKDLVWKKSWPRCFLSLMTSFEILLGVVRLFSRNSISTFVSSGDFSNGIVQHGDGILVYECFRWILGVDRHFNQLDLNVRHRSVQRTFWFSTNKTFDWTWLLVCCTQTIGAATCALIWNLITLLALAILIVFDVIFILNPSTCILTPTCSSQPEVFSLNFIMQLFPMFKNYTALDSKKFFLTIQVGCAGKNIWRFSFDNFELFLRFLGGAFVISALYILIYIICRSRIKNLVVQETRIPSAPNFPAQQFPYAPDVAITRPEPIYPELAAH